MHTNEHNKDGGCGCGHDHSHDHSHKVSGPDETLALLSYMLDHNRHHAEDLHEIYHSLEANGKKEAAAILHEAMDDFNKANDKLEKALKLVK